MLYLQRESNPWQNELKSWWISNRLKTNGLSWKLFDVLAIAVSCYIKNLHMDSQTFYGVIIALTFFHRTHEHENFFNQSKTESVRTQFSPCFLQNTVSTYTWIQQRWKRLRFNPTIPWRKTNNFLQLQIFRKSWAETVNPPQRTLWDSFNPTNLWRLHHWLVISYIPILWSQSNSLSMGTQRTVIKSVF